MTTPEESRHQARIAEARAAIRQAIADLCDCCHVQTRHCPNHPKETQ